LIKIKTKGISIDREVARVVGVWQLRIHRSIYSSVMDPDVSQVAIIQTVQIPYLTIDKKDRRAQKCPCRLRNYTALVDLEENFMNAFRNDAATYSPL